MQCFKSLTEGFVSYISGFTRNKILSDKEKMRIGLQYLFSIIKYTVQVTLRRMMPNKSVLDVY